MFKIKFKHFVLSLTLFSGLFTITTIPVVNNQMNNNSLILNNDITKNNNIKSQNNQIPAISTNKITQNYTVNSFYFNEFLSPTNGQFELINRNSSNNLNKTIFPFVKRQFSNGYQGGILIDLNVWKPSGIDDDVFLKSITIDVNGQISSSRNLDDIKKTKQNFIINKNVETNNENFDNLYVKPSSTANLYWENKEIYRLINLSAVRTHHCDLVFSIAHEVDDKNLINNLWIVPKLVYSYKNDFENFNIYDFSLSTPLTITLQSPLFNYDESKRISTDYFISDNQ